MNNSYTTNTTGTPFNDLYTTTTSGTALSLNNLIDERNERTRNRKKRKRKMESIIGLSKDNEREFADSRIRLLDEGFCDNGFVIKKGTLEKFLNGKNEHIRGWEQTEDGWTQTEVLNLTDDFVGTVNLGHMEFATFPFIVGEWKKSDLTLVDIENDRKALDVDLRLDKESVFVKELARQPYDIGVSAEFYYHINDEDTDSLSEMLGYWMPVFDEIFIFAYGLVGECGNVNSSGLELKGETMSEDKKELTTEESLKVEDIEEVAEETAELGIEEIDIPAFEEVAETSEEAPEESEDTADETEDEGSDEEDEVEETAAEDADDDEDEVEEVELSYAEVIEEITALRKENIELKDHIKALKEEKRGLKKKLQNEYDAKKDFLAKTANLSAELFPNEAEAEKEKEEEAKKLANERKYYKGDGIAD